jgi:hypothetical protein
MIVHFSQRIPTLKEAEKELIDTTLWIFSGNKTHTARALGISLRGLRNKLKEHRLTNWSGRHPLNRKARTDALPAQDGPNFGRI